MNLICIDDEVWELYAAQEQLEYGRQEWDALRVELSTPKNHEQRSVDLTAELVELLGGWWGELGAPDDGTLVFPGETGYLNPTTVLRRELYPAIGTVGMVDQ